MPKRQDPECRIQEGSFDGERTTWTYWEKTQTGESDFQSTFMLNKCIFPSVISNNLGKKKHSDIHVKNTI